MKHTTNGNPSTQEAANMKGIFTSDYASQSIYAAHLLLKRNIQHDCEQAEGSVK